MELSVEYLPPTPETLGSIPVLQKIKQNKINRVPGTLWSSSSNNQILIVNLFLKEECQNGEIVQRLCTVSPYTPYTRLAKDCKVNTLLFSLYDYVLSELEEFKTVYNHIWVWNKRKLVKFFLSSFLRGIIFKNYFSWYIIKCCIKIIFYYWILLCFCTKDIFFILHFVPKVLVWFIST